jgi:20S proteasome alpha/beta subunit
MLYGRRFFPYYAYVILAGIDRDGTGAVYSFDPVGSYERESCRAAGAAQSLVQPFLDNQVRGGYCCYSLLVVLQLRLCALTQLWLMILVWIALSLPSLGL